MVITAAVAVAPRTLWWLALPAFGLLGATVHGRRARAGFGYGALRNGLR